MLAEHFSRLVWLLRHRPAAVDEQKDALRLVLRAARDGVSGLHLKDLSTMVASSAPSESRSMLAEAAERMTVHSVRSLEFGAQLIPAEVLGYARALAAEARLADDGRAFEASVELLGATTVRAITLGQVIAGAQGGGGGQPRQSVLPPAAPAPAAPPTPRAPPPVAPSPVLPAPAPVPPPRALDLSPSMLADIASKKGGTPLETSDGLIEYSVIVTEDRDGAYRDLLAQLATRPPAEDTTQLLHQLTTIADARATQGKWEVVATIFAAIVRGEEAEADRERRLAYSMSIRRLWKRSILSGVAALVPRKPEDRDGLLGVLQRTGADGAEILIDQLTAAESPSDRRAYMSALTKCPEAVPSLIHLLGDSRWFVVRNAADLLGELHAAEAGPPLLETLRHEDVRVRRAAAGALAKLAESASGFRPASALIAAFNREIDAEAQASLLAALGRIPAAESVDCLIEAAKAGGRFFKKKPLSLRVAAIAALGEARTTPALDALRALRDDRESAVREAVQRALSASREQAATHGEEARRAS